MDRDRLEQQLSEFLPIQLDEMGSAGLMDRVDSKYFFNSDILRALLPLLKDDYRVLVVCNNALQEYNTYYFDTKENKMYFDHHNRKGERYKIRVRTYVSNGFTFLELKHRNNKGRTRKKRLAFSYIDGDIEASLKSFEFEALPYHTGELREVINNSFFRITLVSIKSAERCTIDVGLRFKQNGIEKSLENLVVAEIKKSNHLHDSKLENILREMGVKPKSFSKYCIGRAMLEPDLKQNSFKSVLLSLEKILTNEYI